MNKAVHVLVYVILAVAGVALYFEFKLSEKKMLLSDNNEQLRECIVELSSFLEASNAAPSEVQADLVKFSLPGEAREVDFEKDDVLKDYGAQYEATGIGCLNWGSTQLAQLRKPYALDAEGNTQPDPAKPGKFIMEGKGTAAELTKQIVARARSQKDWLKETRATLKDLRTKYQQLVEEYNLLPPVIHKHLITIEEKKKDIETLKEEKAKVEAELENSKKEVEDLKTDVEDLKGKVKDEQAKVEELTEECEKQKKNYDNLMEAFKRMQASTPRVASGNGSVVGGGQLTSGDKGKIERVNNEKLYAVVKFEDSTLDELIGSERNSPLPPHEMLVYRRAKDASGKETKKIVGRIRLRQWTPKTNFVTVDILGEWQQEPFEKGDVVITD